jgi:predicted enzyme related to lactoylglutathione lyase
MKDCLKRHGVLSLNELITTDLEAAKEFSGKLFGWTFTETKTTYGNPYLVAHKEEPFTPLPSPASESRRRSQTE